MLSNKIIALPFGYSFVEELLNWTLKQFKDPRLLAKTTIILPSQNCIFDIFKNLSKRGTLLCPKLITLYDVGSNNPFAIPSIDNLPQVINPVERLEGMVNFVKNIYPTFSINKIIKIAKSLLLLTDEMKSVPIENLKKVIPKESDGKCYKELFDGLANYWPRYLNKIQKITKEQYEREVLLSLSSHLDSFPPEDPFIFTTTANDSLGVKTLIKTIINLPLGYVFLFGLDKEAITNSLSDISPQKILQDLVQSLKLSTEDITFLGKERSFINTFINSKDFSLKEKKEFPIELIVCDSFFKEINVISLIVRHHLEFKNIPIYVVVSSLRMAICLKEELNRWGIGANTPPLKQTTSFLFPLVDFMANPSIKNFIVFLKHPFCNQHDRTYHLSCVYSFEQEVRKKNIGFNEIKTVLAGHDHVKSIFDILEHLTLEKELFRYYFCKLLDVYKKFVSDQKEILKEFIDRFYKMDFGLLTKGAFSVLLKELLKNVQPVGGTYKDSCVYIMDFSEVNFGKPSVVILSEMNEDALVKNNKNTWLNDSMRDAIGLPSSKKATGIFAYHFCAWLNASLVYVTRSLMNERSPTIENRFVQRLKAHAYKNNISIAPKLPWILWEKQLAYEKIEITKSAPTPPTNARPKRFYVTDIEKLMRDPYGFYAKRCLNLLPLQEIERPFERLDWGIMLHAILERCIKEGIKNPNCLIKIAEPYFEKEPILKIFLKEKFYLIVEWFYKKLRERSLKSSFAEQRGEWSFDIDGCAITLLGIADRIDYDKSGNVHIVDYKTGQTPSLKDMANGFSPQLFLEALIAYKGGLGCNKNIKTVSFWKMTGIDEGGEEICLPVTPNDLNKIECGLKNLISYFLKSETPYHICPSSQKAPRYNEYAHLERLFEKTF
ncbi:MAG: PD-(D/E)XK nuclease family protein [Alphaproteobacteria bacterium]